MIRKAIALAVVTTALGAFVAPAQAQFFPFPYRPAPRSFQPPPEYYPPEYQATPRIDRRRVVNYCETQIGTCQTPGPMHLGRGCNCQFPGYGKVPGFAVQG